MKRWLVINTDTSEIAFRHNAEQKPAWMGEYADPHYQTVEAPSNIPEGELTVSISNGVISFGTNNPAKTARVQAERDAKLDQMRALRDAKLAEVDVMVNELVLELRSDKEAVKNYRQALLDFTNVHKKLDGHARAAIDSVDLEDLEWPAKP